MSEYATTTAEIPEDRHHSEGNEVGFDFEDGLSSNRPSEDKKSIEDVAESFHSKDSSSDQSARTADSSGISRAESEANEENVVDKHDPQEKIELENTTHAEDETSTIKEEDNDYIIENATSTTIATFRAVDSSFSEGGADIEETTRKEQISDIEEDSRDGERREQQKGASQEMEDGPPELPPREKNVDPPPLPPRKRTPFFWLRGVSSSSTSAVKGSKPTKTQIFPNTSSLNSSSGYDLLLHRLNANKEGLQARDETERDASLTAIRQLQQDFEEVKTHAASAETNNNTALADANDIDWEFWTQVVNDYSDVAQNKPLELSRAIAAGFPSELRGLIWQLIASSKSSSLEEIYSSIINEKSPHEKAIKRDLSRTSFISTSGSENLYRVIKGYSLFDPEVGYTQGMAFITAPLLLHMSASETFCLLVRLMKDYGLRKMFLPEMPGLHLLLYQFDRILEDTLPDVHIHLARQGVRSSMYASQWFLTLFAYKFPLPLVTRIFDIIIAEGLEAILRFGVALMRKNASTILSLEFDAVLPFLKEKIFDYYLVEHPSKDSEPVYSVNDLVSDAYEVKILPLTLEKYENEYSEIHRLERERVEEVESLRSSNGQLTMQVRRLESSLAELNKEHIQVANEMVQGKLELAKFQDENEELKSELADLKAATKDQSLLADRALRKEMDQIKEQNSTLEETKSRLETQLSNLEQDLVDTKMQLATLDDSHSKLQTKWNELKKHIDDSMT